MTQKRNKKLLQERLDKKYLYATIRRTLKNISVHYRNHRGLYWIAGIFIIISFAYQWLLLRNYSQYIFDLGMWNRHFWSLIHFDLGPNPVKGFNLFGDHASFLLVALAPIYALFQHVEFFFLVQSVAVGVSIFPAFLIARRYFNDWQSYVWIILFLSFFGFWSAFTYNFHEIIVGVPLLTWLIYFYIENKWKSFFIMALVLLLLREDMPLYVIAFALAALLFKGQRKIGLVLIAVSVAYYLVVTQLIMPYFSGVTYYQTVTPLGSSLPQIAKNALLHPHLFINTFFSSDLKTETFLALFASFGFLAFLSPTGLLLLAPALIARFLSVQSYRWGFSEHYSATQGPLLFGAAILGANNILVWCAKHKPHIKPELIKQVIIIVTITAGIVAAVGAQAHYKTFANMTEINFYRRNDVIRSTDKAASLIPAGASVSASSSFPQLTTRKNIYLWPGDLQVSKKITNNLKAVRPEYIIVSIQLDDAYMPETKDELLKKIDDDKQLGYHEIFNENGAIVLKRN